MKNAAARPRVGLLLALLALPSTAALAPASVAPEHATGSSARPEEEFMTEFRQAMKLGSITEMARLVRTHEEAAVEAILNTGERIAREKSEELYDEMDALARAWKEAFDSRFGLQMFEYFDFMNKTVLGERQRLRGALNDLYTRYHKVAEGPDSGKASQLDQLSGDFEDLAEGFTRYEDHYHASQCWLAAGQCAAEGVRPIADNDRVIECFEKGIIARDQVDLGDSNYNKMKLEVQRLEGLKKGGGPASTETGEAGGADPIGEVATVVPGARIGEPKPVALSFKVMEKPDAVARPHYSSDEVFMAWSSVWLSSVGSSGNFYSINPPSLIRTGAGQVEVDLDGDDRGDVEVPLTGNSETVEVQLGEGEEARSWAFLARLGGEAEQYNGIEVNVSPQDAGLALYVFPAGAMEGTVDGIDITVLDDNMDGVYGSLPLLYGHIGVSSGNFQPEMDSVLIGRSKKALPWSEFMQIEDRWYKLESAKGGTELQVSPAQVETGRLKLSYKGGKPSFLVVRGGDTFENSFFDLTEGGSKGLEVPVGTYTLFGGALKEGKRQQVAKALIIPGEDSPTWTVQAGKTTTIEMGAPFGFDFEYSNNSDSITVFGDTVTVTGAAGERYERLWNCTTRPEVSYRRKGSKRGSKPEDMPVVLDQDTLYSDGWQRAWHPMDLTISKGHGDDEVEVQLTEGKNKLFGKIESIWRE